jgi:hypothetical protein
MPTFEITGPDGSKYRVTGPEGSTEKDALARVQSQFSQSPVTSRFAEFQQPANATALQSGLERTARNITTGPRMSPIQQMQTQHENLLSAASQGATPNVDILSKNLISTEVFQGDDGSIQYRDPQTKQLVSTDNTKHIALRDPADGRVKVFARTPGAQESTAVGVSRVLAPGLMAGAPTARASIPALNNVQPKASDIFATAKPSYRAFEQQARATPVPEGIPDRIRAGLDKIGSVDELAGAPVKTALNYIEGGKAASMNDLQKAKRMIGYGFKSPEQSVRDASGVATRELMSSINDVAPSAAANLRKADEIHATALALKELQTAEAISKLRSGRAGYGGNAVNTMRQVLSPIVQNAEKGLKTSFKPDEIAAIRDIVQGTPTTNSLRWAGQFSPSSGLGALRSAGAGGGAMMAGLGSTVAAAIPAIGAASNKLATILTSKQVDRLKELVAKRSPEYAAAVSRAVARYERAQMELVNNPAPNKLSAYLSASRALSAGLTKDGITISSGDLLRAIQAPVKSAAEEDEPAVPWRPSQ